MCLNTFLVVRLKFLSFRRQILDLLHVRDELAAPQYQGVAVGAVHLMAEARPGLARPLLLLPLLAPLRRCVPAPLRQVQNVDLLTGERRSQEAVEEWELTRCIDDVYKVSPDKRAESGGSVEDAAPSRPGCDVVVLLL